MSIFSGGLSNYLYLCALPEDWATENGEPRKVLLRLYGEILLNNTEFLVNDSVIFALLSERQIGPKLFGVFQGGRVEEYIKVRYFLLIHIHFFYLFIIQIIR